jgi:hypothetical protein
VGAQYEAVAILLNRTQFLFNVRWRTFVRVPFFYTMDSMNVNDTTENEMGNSLHNKIYLGRSTGFAMRRFQGVLAVGAIVGAGLVWIALRTLR